MAGGAQDPDEEMISGINVTPLVDITLVLLIIFMVTATYIVRETIEVDLPRAASGGETVGTTLNLVLDKEGKLYVDGAEATADAARDAVRAAVAKDPDSRAIISADKSVSHGQVVELIDLVKTQGLTKFAINIEKDAASEATP
ncbi:ExbD/TolR family protein [Vulgatibacter incomptus]|uniref:Biopolymer transport protein ExbD/TolR n=1 Tax=Vulgatibacter incomptus TaxID=1391653 RepID=A0A0K1PFY9_9BACT|nr:biopolymer transporter ExbD [Vulgatibacter incomptus]AKU92331.1 Biopolymer transport protein ExbD/TolR [Vulgatibacter incomptus]